MRVFAHSAANLYRQARAGSRRLPPQVGELRVLLTNAPKGDGVAVALRKCGSFPCLLRSTEELRPPARLGSSPPRPCALPVGAKRGFFAGPPPTSRYGLAEALLSRQRAISLTVLLGLQPPASAVLAKRHLSACSSGRLAARWVAWSRWASPHVCRDLARKVGFRHAGVDLRRDRAPCQRVRSSA